MTGQSTEQMDTDGQLRRTFIATVVVLGALGVGAIATAGRPRSDEAQMVVATATPSIAESGPGLRLPLLPNVERVVLPPDIAPRKGGLNFNPDLQRSLYGTGVAVYADSIIQCDTKEATNNNWVMTTIPPNQTMHRALGVIDAAGVVIDAVDIQTTRHATDVHILPLYGQARTFDQAYQSAIYQYQTAMGSWVTAGVTQLDNRFDYAVQMSCGQNPAGSPFHMANATP